MSFMDKVKSFFSGGSAAGADEHAGHDHSGHGHDHDHDHSHEAPMPPADPMGAPMAEPMADEGEDRPA